MRVANFHGRISRSGVYTSGGNSPHLVKVSCRSVVAVRQVREFYTISFRLHWLCRLIRPRSRALCALCNVNRNQHPRSPPFFTPLAYSPTYSVQAFGVAMQAPLTKYLSMACYCKTDFYVYTPNPSAQYIYCPSCPPQSAVARRGEHLLH
jgi:hypothetical protein